MRPLQMQEPGYLEEIIQIIRDISIIVAFLATWVLLIPYIVG